MDDTPVAAKRRQLLFVSSSICHSPVFIPQALLQRKDERGQHAGRDQLFQPQESGDANAWVSQGGSGAAPYTHACAINDVPDRLFGGLPPLSFLYTRPSRLASRIVWSRALEIRFYE
jgi:hypothetical protein